MAMLLGFCWVGAILDPAVSAAPSRSSRQVLRQGNEMKVWSLVQISDQGAGTECGEMKP